MKNKIKNLENDNEYLKYKNNEIKKMDETIIANEMEIDKVTEEKLKAYSDNPKLKK